MTTRPFSLSAICAKAVKMVFSFIAVFREKLPANRHNILKKTHNFFILSVCAFFFVLLRQTEFGQPADNPAHAALMFLREIFQFQPFAEFRDKLRFLFARPAFFAVDVVFV